MLPQLYHSGWARICLLANLVVMGPVCWIANSIYFLPFGKTYRIGHFTSLHLFLALKDTSPTDCSQSPHDCQSWRTASCNGRLWRKVFVLLTSLAYKINKQNQTKNAWWIFPSPNPIPSLFQTRIAQGRIQGKPVKQLVGERAEESGAPILSLSVSLGGK